MLSKAAFHGKPSLPPSLPAMAMAYQKGSAEPRQTCLSSRETIPYQGRVGIGVCSTEDYLFSPAEDDFNVGPDEFFPKLRNKGQAVTLSGVIYKPGAGHLHEWHLTCHGWGTGEISVVWI